MKSFRVLAVLASFSVCTARHEPLVCGYDGENWREELQLHRQSLKGRKLRPRAAQLSSIRADNGNIALLDDSDGVVARRNSFDLNKKGIQFVPLTPNASKYKYVPANDIYDTTAAASGTLIDGLGDDDSREAKLPFAFPFYGASYTSVWINSDGNLTFTKGDADVTNRSLGRAVSGPPRLMPLFDDLDPSHATGGVYISSDAGRFVVSWVDVPEFADSGNGTLQTFQARLYPDGRIEYAYRSVSALEAVVGIAPGHLSGSPSLVDFTSAVAEEYTSAVVERFAGSDAVDIFSAAQKFYLNHDDAYDYLVIYNAMDIRAGATAVAYEVTTRNTRTGYGDGKVDVGIEAGSSRRLQAILNMGPIKQYPLNPNSPVPTRSTDTPLTVLGHETGHLFLAYASVLDPDNPTNLPMLGRDFVHWNFGFNSEASLLEGNRIRDNGASVSPRFTTTAIVEGYSPLDQYLMGFIPAEQVPDTFYVKNPTTTTGSRAPQVGVNFNGDRVNVAVNDVIHVVGRRSPDYTVSQRHFRFAFVLVTAAGVIPTADQLAQVDTYRHDFEAAFSRFSAGNATADTVLAKAVQLSTAPAAGVLSGGIGTATVALDHAAQTATTFSLRTQSGAAIVPSTVIIPAGATQATFSIRGVRIGVDDLVAQPADSSFETAYSRIQVGAASDLKVIVVSGDEQSGIAGTPLADAVVFQLLDVNQVPYAGVPVHVRVTGGGSVDTISATTDALGTVSLRWTPGPGEINELRVSTDSGATAAATMKASPKFAAANVVNAASYSPGITAGGIATIFGTNLSNATVTVGGVQAQVFYSDAQQINFLVPGSVPVGNVDVTVSTPGGNVGPTAVPVLPNSPGIFFDSATGYGAILIANTASVTQVRPAGAGDFIEIYGTGFASGPVQVSIAGQPAEVVFAGAAPSFAGLYQIDAKIPSGLPAGAQSLVATQNGAISNTVKVQLK